MQRVRKLVCIVTVCFMIISLGAGCGVLQKLGLEKNDYDELRPASSIVMSEEEAQKISDKMPFNLYFANAENTKLKLEVRYIPLSEVKKTAKDKSEAVNLATIIMKELIKGPGENTGLKGTIPKGTTLRSVSIKSGVATVDLSKEFVDKHPGGAAAAKLTLYSVVNSLTELKEVEKVKFTIQGKTRTEFKDSFQMDAPFPRMASLISTAVSLPGAGTSDKGKTQEKGTADKAKDPGTDKAEPSKDTKKTGDAKKQDTKQQDAGQLDGSDSGQAAGEAIDDDSEGVYLDTLEEDTLE